MSEFDLNFAYAGQEPTQSALLKSQNEHFLVDEDLGFEPSGDGEHCYLHVQSNGENTQWIAEQIAQAVDKRPVDVGFCGLKDRNAITRQWFSVYDPQRQVESKLPELETALPNSQLLAVSRDATKLRRGQHAANGFVITLLFDEPLVEGCVERNAIDQRLRFICERGVPNYFGLQRFGRGGNNLAVFDRWLIQKSEGKRLRKPKGIIISAARSYIFNSVLSYRVERNNWCERVAGDVLEGQWPTGVMWGRGRSASQADALVLEDAALGKGQERREARRIGVFADALEHLGLQQERRALVCKPSGFEWRWCDQGVLRLTFSLPPGQYATSVIRELCKTYEPERPRNSEG